MATIKETKVTIHAQTDLPDMAGDIFDRIHTYARAHGFDDIHEVEVELRIVFVADERRKHDAEGLRERVMRLWLAGAGIDVKEREIPAGAELKNGRFVPVDEAA
jgi:hypothetical protein